MTLDYFRMSLVGLFGGAGFSVTPPTDPTGTVDPPPAPAARFWNTEAGSMITTEAGVPIVLD